MSGFTLSTTCPLPFGQTVTLAREALAGAGFGVLTEIDFQATMAEKLGEQVPAQVILGACNPRYAYAATKAEPSIAALLPCNVVVRSVGESSTIVEAFDPAAMARLAGSDAPDLEPVVKDVRALLSGMLEQIDQRVRELKED